MKPLLCASQGPGLVLNLELITFQSVGVQDFLPQDKGRHLPFVLPAWVPPSTLYPSYQMSLQSWASPILNPTSPSPSMLTTEGTVPGTRCLA